MQRFSIFNKSNEVKAISKDELSQKSHDLIAYLKELFKPSIDLLFHQIIASNVCLRSIFRAPEVDEHLKYEYAYQDALAGLTQPDDAAIQKLRIEHPKSASTTLYELQKSHNTIYEILAKIGESRRVTPDDKEALNSFRDAKFSKYKPAFDKMNEFIQFAASATASPSTALDQMGIQDTLDDIKSVIDNFMRRNLFTPYPLENLRAIFHRAQNLAKQGQFAAARKQLNKVMSQVPGLCFLKVPNRPGLNIPMLRKQVFYADISSRDQRACELYYSITRLMGEVVEVLDKPSVADGPNSCAKIFADISAFYQKRFLALGGQLQQDSSPNRRVVSGVA